MSLPLRDLNHCNPGNWKLGIFYFCRADPRMMVPKRMRGLGWTLNFARPLAVPWLFFLIALVLGLLELLRSLRGDGDARFALQLLAALGLLALCYRLFRPARGKRLRG